MRFGGGAVDFGTCAIEPVVIHATSIASPARTMALIDPGGRLQIHDASHIRPQAPINRS